MATTAKDEVVEAGIQLVARTMIARYGDQASASAANRARVLEACGDRDTSRYWDLVREQIDDFDRSPPRRGRFFSDGESDFVAAVLEVVFEGGAPRDEPDDGAEYDGDAGSLEADSDLKPSSE